MWGWKFRKRRRSASWWIASAITRRRRGAKDASATIPAWKDMTPEQKTTINAEVHRALHPIFGGQDDRAERQDAEQTSPQVRTERQKATLELEHYRALHPLFGGKSDDSPPFLEQPGRTASCYPTAEEINDLPDKFRQYIHDLETRCDKSGDVQTMALLREDRDALQIRIEELEAEVDRLKSAEKPRR
jgi:hypothetical protein